PEQLTILAHRPLPRKLAKGPQMTDSAHDYSWELFDPSECYVQFVSTGVRLSPGAARYFSGHPAAEAMLDRQARALGLVPAEKDGPMSIALQRSGGAALVGSRKLAELF